MKNEATGNNEYYLPDNTEFVMKITMNDKSIKYHFNQLTKKLTIIGDSEGELNVECILKY